MDSSFAAWAAKSRVPLGFLLSAAYLILAQPSRTLLLTGASLALLGIFLRAWAAGHLEKDQRLSMTGPYAYTRNPLYLGSLLIGLGFSLAGRSWILALAFSVFFASIYQPVMRQEEQRLLSQFGETYREYAERVPLLFPRGRGGAGLGQGFCWKRYRRNREYQAALGYIAGIIFLALKLWLRQN